MGAFSAIGFSLVSDRFNWRLPFILAPQSLLLIAYPVLFVYAAVIADNVALCYVMVVIACMGVYPIIPGTNAWTLNNLANAEKRNMGSGYFISLGNCGGMNLIRRDVSLTNT